MLDTFLREVIACRGLPRIERDHLVDLNKQV
jgi:hypothetical protein